MAALKQRGTTLYAGKENEARLADLREHRLVFLYTDLSHGEVVYKRQEFRDFLKTSCFKELEN